MRLVDVTLAFPFLVLMIAIIAVLGPGLTSFYIAMALVGWVSYARLVRAQILVLKSSEFILAARAAWATATLRIMFRHMLPNALVPSIVFSMSDVVLVILAGSAISYLGLGVQPPTAEVGRDDRRGPELHDHGVVDHHLPGSRHRVPGARLQPARGRARREAGRPRMSAPLLEVEDLTVEFATPGGAVRAVDGVSFTLGRGEVLGLVGESGSGKTVTCRALIRLLPSRRARIVAGRVRLDGIDLLALDEAEMQRVRGAASA